MSTPDEPLDLALSAMSTADGLLAATTREHRLTRVTRDVEDLLGLNLELGLHLLHRWGA